HAALGTAHPAGHHGSVVRLHRPARARHRVLLALLAVGDEGHPRGGSAGDVRSADRRCVDGGDRGVELAAFAAAGRRAVGYSWLSTTGLSATGAHAIPCWR